VAYSTSRPLYLWERDPMLIVQEHVWAPGTVWKGAENLVPPRFDTRTFRPVSSPYADYSISAQLFSLWENEIKHRAKLRKVNGNYSKRKTKLLELSRTTSSISSDYLNYKWTKLNTNIFTSTPPSLALSPSLLSLFPTTITKLFITLCTAATFSQHDVFSVLQTNNKILSRRHYLLQ
jgi:hypothetical protein